MQAGYSTATERIREMGFGAGMGLGNIKNFSDFFRITFEIGKGTCLKMVIRIDKDFRRHLIITTEENKNAAHLEYVL